MWSGGTSYLIVSMVVSELQGVQIGVYPLKLFKFEDSGNKSRNIFERDIIQSKKDKFWVEEIEESFFSADIISDFIFIRRRNRISLDFKKTALLKERRGQKNNQKGT